MNATLGSARQQLEEHGEFFPYGPAIDLEGELRLVAADVEGQQHPSSTDVLDMLAGGLRDDRENLRAAAMVAALGRGSSLDAGLSGWR